MNEQYPNLSWALIDNLYLKNVIFEEYKHNSRYLFYINDLISELISYKCEGIQEKLKDVKTLKKFSSILSELEFALLIAKNKEINELKLLPDDYLPSKSPDILFRDELITYYVEVTRVNENPHIRDRISSRLREILKSHPYRVDVSLNTELSIPKMKRIERHIQKDLVEKSLDTFEDIFKEKLTKNTFQTPSDVIDTESLTFTIERTDSGKGYPRFISSDYIEVPTDVLCDYIKERLIEKATKRNSFGDEHRKAHYIIALDCCEPSIDEIDINKLLYDRTEGIFLSETEMKNVSGVLFRGKWDKITFYPNPFCDAEINDPKF